MASGSPLHHGHLTGLQERGGSSRRLAVDGARAQAGDDPVDQREPVGQVIAGAAVEAHAAAVLARDHAEAVVLDLVQPCVAGGGRCALVGRQGGTKPSGRVRGRDKISVLQTAEGPGEVVASPGPPRPKLFGGLHPVWVAPGKIGSVVFSSWERSASNAAHPNERAAKGGGRTTPVAGPTLPDQGLQTRNMV